MFHLSVPQMVFDEVSRLRLGRWETFLFSDHPGCIRTAEGYGIDGIHDLDAARGADVLVMPSWFSDRRPPSEAVCQLLKSEHAAGAVIVGLCLGAFPVADAGLIGERSAVTHWYAFDQLAQRHPVIDLDESVLYIDHGDVLTSAGTASGLDACLHFVRSRLGASAANAVARSLVIAPHREGGQAQYIERPLPPQPNDDSISRVMDWVTQHLSEPLNIEKMANAAHMSTRTFVRNFRAATGTTPAVWVRERRLDEARRMLEVTDESVDKIAAECGFGSPVTLRQHFAAAFKTSPTLYRRHFRSVPSSSA
ncbi:MAG: helix-turn-helix domain-containing protein [Rhodococcus sp.]|nr:helix-turn-helix domain-containing protein [Rhodococcus sp. (in: high G+C Gram-positive bacteria)]